MNPETKNCQNCKKDFIIEPDDFLFYEKIKVPPPTFCFPCRLQRKLVFRNERRLYNAVCDLCKEKTLSTFPNGNSQLVYCVSCWTSEKWQAEDYSQNYNFSETFFSQFKRLLQVIPIRALNTSGSRNFNSKYSNTSSNLKNCYLVFGSDDCEDCIYGTEITRNSSYCVDCMMVSSVSNSIESINCNHCSNIRHCIDCKDSLDISFSKNLINCSKCLGCVNLRNKKYCIFNEQLSEKEYFKKLKDYKLDTYSGECNMFERSRDFFMKFPVKFFHGFSNNDCSGDYIYNSKNVKNSFIITESENCKYCFNIVVKNVKDCMDYSDWGANVENVYESQTCGFGISNLKFCLVVTKNSIDCEYSAHCVNCRNIFGCVGLKNKQYYIFNKKYNKDDYFKLRERILKHMDDMPYVDKRCITYKYGEFFPAEISLFPYNDTTAQDIFTLNENQAKSLGFNWSTRENKHKYDISFSDIVDNINDIDDRYLEKIIMCRNEKNPADYPYCIGGFKIIKEELDFYKRNKIPLPRYCFNCRYYRRLKEINHPKLWHRHCMKEGCTNEFETSYSPDRPEIVYCEKCYQQEVY